MTRRLNIGIDLDGVVYDLVQEMLPMLRDLAGRAVLKEDIVEFDIPRSLGLTATNRELFVSVAERDFYCSASRPMPLAKRYIADILEAGHRVTLVSSRPKRVAVSAGEIDVEAKTRSWVQQHFGDSLPLKVRGEESGEPTEKVTAEDAFHIFVDDDPSTLECLAALRIRTRPVAFDQPWNQSWGGERVYNWSQLSDLVKHEASWWRLLLG